jgi:hypothetical protein
MPELLLYKYISQLADTKLAALPLILFEKCVKFINFNAIHFSHLWILLFMFEMNNLIIFQSKKTIDSVYLKVH